MHVLYSVALVIYFLTLLPAVVYRRVRHGRLSAECGIDSVACLS